LLTGDGCAVLLPAFSIRAAAGFTPFREHLEQKSADLRDLLHQAYDCIMRYRPIGHHTPMSDLAVLQSDLKVLNWQLARYGTFAGLRVLTMFSLVLQAVGPTAAEVSMVPFLRVANELQWMRNSYLQDFAWEALRSMTVALADERERNGDPARAEKLGAIYSLTRQLDAILQYYLADVAGWAAVNHGIYFVNEEAPLLIALGRETAGQPLQIDIQLHYYLSAAQVERQRELQRADSWDPIRPFGSISAGTSLPSAAAAASGNAAAQ
jgi:hypothetical protein